MLCTQTCSQQRLFAAVPVYQHRNTKKKKNRKLNYFSQATIASFSIQTEKRKTLSKKNRTRCCFFFFLCRIWIFIRVEFSAVRNVQRSDLKLNRQTFIFRSHHIRRKIVYPVRLSECVRLSGGMANAKESCVASKELFIVDNNITSRHYTYYTHRDFGICMHDCPITSRLGNE